MRKKLESLKYLTKSEEVRKGADQTKYVFSI